MTEKPIVLIGCPAQNRQDCIADYLKHIYELAYPKDRIILSFFVNNSTDKTGEIIQDFLNVHKDEYKAVKYHEGKVLKGRQDNQTRLTRRDYNLFAVVRNTFLRKIKPLDFDYFFSVDSDVLLNPDDLNQLLSHNKDVVSAVLFNGVKDNIDYYNIFKMTNQGYRPFKTSFLNNYSGLVEVDVTGACYLISKKVLNAGVKYGNYPAGEDGYFCRKAQSKGFKLYADTTVRPVHLLDGKVEMPKQKSLVMT
jgi:cellulose synthase/poly-beta-1,6-N-acetylglucosamine synthase-like glycosyltransferase